MSSLYAMPFLIMNYGGEMVYILEQRLHAQKIPAEKANKVLQDVGKAMFSDKFVAELLKEQHIYSPPATREIFDRLAHSSIMRLSESSMDKLYDLMTMGFKYQLISCVHPREVIEITLNHIDSIRASINAQSGASVISQIDEALIQLTNKCRELSTAEFAQIRQALAGFLQDKRVKVSLFLQDQIQNADGTIVIPKGGPLPNDSTFSVPGTISYFDATGGTAGTDNFAYPLASSITGRLVGDPYSGNRDSKLGRNLYTIDRSAKSAQPAPATEAAKPAAAPPTAVKKPGSSSAVQRELQSLAELVGSNKVPEAFKLQLFPEASDDSLPNNREIVISKVDREEIRKNNASLYNIIDDLNVQTSGTKEDDLLDLMDKS